jgi:hypothetical protein
VLQIICCKVCIFIIICVCVCLMCYCLHCVFLCCVFVFVFCVFCIVFVCVLCVLILFVFSIFSFVFIIANQPQTGNMMRKSILLFNSFPSFQWINTCYSHPSLCKSSPLWTQNKRLFATPAKKHSRDDAKNNFIVPNPLDKGASIQLHADKTRKNLPMPTKMEHQRFFEMLTNPVTLPTVTKEELQQIPTDPDVFFQTRAKSVENYELLLEIQNYKHELNRAIETFQEMKVCEILFPHLFFLILLLILLLFLLFFLLFSFFFFLAFFLLLFLLFLLLLSDSL